MFVARWNIDVKITHKEIFLHLQKEWLKSVGEKIGWKRSTLNVLDKSKEKNEANFVLEVIVDSISELENSFTMLYNFDTHKRFWNEIQPYIIPSSNNWKIFKLVEL